MYVAIVLGIFVLENYTWQLPITDPGGMGVYTPTSGIENKANFKCIAQIHALEFKANFINK